MLFRSGLPGLGAQISGVRDRIKAAEQRRARAGGLLASGKVLAGQGGFANLQEALAKYESAQGIWPGLSGLAAQINAVRDKIKAAAKLRRLAGEFVPVPGGCYQMGGGSWAGDCYSDERPVHEVCVDSFKIGKYEITQGEWQAVMGNNPSDFKDSNRPVEHVSWDDVQAFIHKLNSITGKHFRLPTEAE